MNKLYIAAGVAAVLGLFFLSKKRPGDPNTGVPEPVPGSGDTQPNVAPSDVDGTFRSALQVVKNNYGLAVAKDVERVYRLETGNFTSGGFRRTNTAGMKAVAGRDVFPFGWSLASAGLQATDFNPPIVMVDNGEGRAAKWVVFKDFTKAVNYLGYYINRYNPGGAVRWNGGGVGDYAARIARTPTPTADSLA